MRTRLVCTRCWIEGLFNYAVVIVQGPGPLCWIHAADHFEDFCGVEVNWDNVFKQSTLHNFKK